MHKPWLEHYPKGVPADITQEAAAIPSLAQVFDDACARYADRYAYQCMGAAMRYDDLAHHACALAAWLQSQGVDKGDRVALMMPNLMQYPVSLYAVLRAGAIVVNCNPLCTAYELAQQLRDSGATSIIIAENFAHTLQQIIKDTAIERVIVTGIGDLLGGMKGVVTNLVVRHVKRMTPPWRLPGAIRFNDALKTGARMPFTAPELTHADTAFLQYTGGTTGTAKAAILTHGNLVSNLCQALAWLKPHTDPERSECVVTALPLYHIFALTANCLVFLHLGAKNLLIVNARDIAGMIKELSVTRFTAITGVNTLFQALLRHPRFQSLDFSDLHLVLGGGMAVQETVAREWLALTGTPIVQAYGLTETSPAVTINPLDNTEFTGAIGLPVPSTQVVIRDDYQHTLPAGDVGEICVRGPQVTPGYWNQPQETALAFDDDGFFRTGDIGYMDDQGYVYVLDRKKDMILVSGFNVYPNEIEAVALQHPDILDAAAVGMPSPRSGEAVKLCVISRNSQLTADDVIAHCRRMLSGYKVPKAVEFHTVFPRSHVGKTLRRKLKEDGSQAR